MCVVMEQMQGKDSPTFNVDGIDANVTDACQKMSTKSINYGSMNRLCTNTRLFTRYIYVPYTSSLLFRYINSIRFPDYAALL